MNLQKEKEYGRLADSFGAYTKLAKATMAEQERIPALDEELMGIYLDMLEQTGSAELRTRISRYANGQETPAPAR